MNRIKSGSWIFGMAMILIFALGSFTSPVHAIEKYKSPDQVNKKIMEIAQKSSSMVKVHTLAKSAGGTDLLILEIGSEVGKSAKSLPAILVVGNMGGINPISTEAAIWLAESLVADMAMQNGKTWYILPMGNPDAYSRYFKTPLYLDMANATPYNEDKDDLTDEDGYNDLDGDGFITGIRVKAPDGTMIPVASDPRLMRKADASKGEKGIYKLYTEGIDDDGDGKYNEDLPGGTNIGITFPHLFKYFDNRSGLYPGSEKETFEMMKFVYSHPEIAMSFSFGPTNFLLTPPKGGRTGSVDMEKITVPEEMAGMLGLDHTKTYSMKEIMEAVQPILPPGMEITEGMIASFLGLGAVVNPMQEDLVFYNRISEEYKKFLKDKGFEPDRFDPEPAKDGSFELWSYYHLGVPVFSMDLWALSKVKEEKKASSGITVESLEKMTSEEFVALGEEKIDMFLKEKGAPDQFKAAGVIGMIGSGQFTPKQMAGMIKQMPEPAGDTQKGDPKEQALLAFSDKYLDGKGFTEWKPYKHPTLGDVEIGGFVPFTDNTPPAAMVDSLIKVQVPFIFELVKQLPKLQILDIKSTSKGGGVYEVVVWFENDGLLPFTTAMGKRNQIPVPAFVLFEGDGVKLLSGKKRSAINELDGKKAVKMTWLVQSDKKSTVTVKVESNRAGSDSKQINIGG
jgi:hypothetical protein